MKILPNWGAHDEIALVAETEDDRNCLRRFWELRERCALRASQWEFVIENPRNPTQLSVARVSLHLIDDGVFEAQPETAEAARTAWRWSDSPPWKA